jgi:hypothetical protein
LYKYTLLTVSSTNASHPADQLHNYIMASIKSSLYYGAAAINLLIIPKHLYVGATNVSSAIKTIPEENPSIKRGKEVVGTTWDLVNGGLVILGIANQTHRVIRIAADINSFTQFPLGQNIRT